jgi:hypothetical protein
MLAYDRVEDQIDNAPLPQAVAIAGVFTDKFQLLSGDATAHAFNLNVKMEPVNIVEHFERLHAGIEIAAKVNQARREEEAITTRHHLARRLLIRVLRPVSRPNDRAKARGRPRRLQLLVSSLLGTARIPRFRRCFAMWENLMLCKVTSSRTDLWSSPESAESDSPPRAPRSAAGAPFL